MAAAAFGHGKAYFPFAFSASIASACGGGARKSPVDFPAIHSRESRPLRAGNPGAIIGSHDATQLKDIGVSKTQSSPGSPNATSVGLHLRILQQADGKACNAQHFPLNL